MSARLSTVALTRMAALTLIAATLAAPGSASGEAFDVCVEPSWEAAMAVLRLDERTPSARLRPQRPAACSDQGPRLRVVGEGARVRVELRTGGGHRLTRTLPWPARDEPLVTLARQGRLGALAVVIEGLLIEDRALRAARRTAAPTPTPTPNPALPPADAVAAAQPEQPEMGAEARAALDPPPTPPPGRTPRAEPGRAINADRARAPIGRPATRASRRARRALTTEVRNVTASSPTADRRAGAARAAAPLRDPPGPTSPAVWDPPAPEPAPFPAGPPVATAPPPSPERLAGRPPTAHTPTRPRPQPAAAQVGAFVAVAARAPSIFGGELGARAAWGGLRAQVGYLLPTTWSLGDRPIESAAVFGQFGYAARLAGGRSWRADLVGGLAGERLTVRRLGLTDAQTRARWEAGLDLALRWGWSMGADWHAGLTLGGRWLPTADEVVIPDGPRAALNTWRMRLAIELGWGTTSW